MWDYVRTLLVPVAVGSDSNTDARKDVILSMSETCTRPKYLEPTHRQLFRCQLLDAQIEDRAGEEKTTE